MFGLQVFVFIDSSCMTKIKEVFAGRLKDSAV